MTGDMDPRTNFSLVVLQTELERFKFLVRSYLRARIAKVRPPFTPSPLPYPFISPSYSPRTHPSYRREQDTPADAPQIDKHTLHYLPSPNLSPTEHSYATHHSALLHTHYLTSFLSSLPPQLRNLDDTAGNVDMVTRPDPETAVFARLLRDAEVAGRGTDEDSVARGREGDVFVVRWEGVRGLVEAGTAELV